MHGGRRGTAVAEDEPAQTDSKIPPKRPRIAKLLRVLTIPIILFWIAVAVGTSVLVPSLEDSTKANAGAMVPTDAPSSRAAVRIGKAFTETHYTSVAVVLLETHGRKLGEQDHRYYDEVVHKLRENHKHVQAVIDLWGDPVTMSGQQSADGDAATVNVSPTGDQADANANASIEAIRDTVNEVPKPSGLNVYITGPAPLAADSLEASDKSMFKLTIVTIALIIVMLVLAYRSLTIALIPLFGVLIILTCARGIVSLLVQHHVIGISSFAANMLVSLVLGASTDYGIFFLGRYQEARQSGQNREDSYFKHVPHVITGSGLAISGACPCLTLTRLDYFRTLDPALFVSMIVAVVGALTLGPALLTAGSSIKRLDLTAPKHQQANPIWQKFGTCIARWPIAMIAVAALIIALCILNLTNYTVSYNDRDFTPQNVESIAGYAAADRHFPKSHLSVDTIYVEADHDMRNTTDMISLDRIAKKVFHVPGIAMVQSITRPNGRPLEHASLPFAMGSMGTKIGEHIGFLSDRIADIDTLASKMGTIVELTTQMESLTDQMSVGTHISRDAADQLKVASDLARDNLANLDDFLRPIRSYFYWEKHCFDIPLCWALRSFNETIDNTDQMAEQLGYMLDGITIIDEVTPQMAAQLHDTAQNMRTMQSLTLTVQSLLHATIPQLDSMVNPMVDMATAFDNAKNDDFFFMPPESFETDDFKAGVRFFMTADGRGARMMVYHTGEAMSVAGINQIEDATGAAREAIKGTSLSNTQIYVAGASSNYRDVQEFSHKDIAIMMLATFALVFLIVLLVTRALVGAIIVLLTVILSFAGAFGLSVFVWETLLGVQLHWLTLPIGFIVLVAVGCDYNLLLLSRYKEELGAGIQTGVIRTMRSSGSVVVTAGFVFAFTMLALLSSDVINIGQSGVTICIGLIFDMLIVRLFLVMPLARLLGPWFWWPQRITRSVRR
ncbi:RND family transporter [Mycobacterium sp.]|uniref:MMPL/RND family transporter n=1 Tax=Mycobacterium sp. TaxID=1785 RepID=UPI003A8642E4